MRHGSLFSGIGGFDLAAEWMGWENVFHCEWNPFGQRVLHHYWPNAETFTDITKTDFTKYYGSIDIISGGFPCQPYSSAGKRKGKEDERHLWPEMLRAIREISPSYVVGENVRGLTNWNGGMVFDEVCAELESLGYQVAPVIIPACSVGAPHKRERVWFVAYCESNRSTIGELGESQSKQQIQTRCDIDGFESVGDATNPNGSRLKTDDSMRESERKVEPARSYGENVSTNAKSNGFEQRDGNNEKQPSQRGLYAQRNIHESDGNGHTANANGEGFQGGQNAKGWEKYSTKRTGTSFEFRAEDANINGKFRSDFKNFPTEPPICGGDDGLPTELDGITFPKWRAESIKAYGNAIVPQVAYEIFKAIKKTI